jgi:hypothetical protein
MNDMTNGNANDTFGQPPPHDTEGAVFGAMAGLFFGVLAGIGCGLLLDQIDSLWAFGLVCGLAGLPVGAVIGRKDRCNNAGTTNSNIATHIGVLYGLLPGCLVLLGGIGIIKGKLSGMVMLGAFFGCPMTGMLIGGLLDRLYESRLRSRRARAAQESTDSWGE